jgi:hypothetical protein
MLPTGKKLAEGRWVMASREAPLRIGDGRAGTCKQPGPRLAPLSHDAAVAFIDTLRRFPVQGIPVPLMRAGLATGARWGISYWDATIVEAARSLACTLLLSEDLQHGQDFDGMLVQNPFL